jgi:hypothetical protein
MIVRVAIPRGFPGSIGCLGCTGSLSAYSPNRVGVDRRVRPPAHKQSRRADTAVRPYDATRHNLGRPGGERGR